MFAEAAFIVGVVLALLSAAMFRHTRTFIARCRETTGRVDAYTTEDSEEGIYYFTIIHFRDVAGTEHEMRGARGLQRPPKVGTVVSITYDPTYPANAWITGSAAPWIIPSLILIAGVGFIVAGFVIRV